MQRIDGPGAFPVTVRPLVVPRRIDDRHVQPGPLGSPIQQYVVRTRHPEHITDMDEPVNQCPLGIFEETAVTPRFPGHVGTISVHPERHRMGGRRWRGRRDTTPRQNQTTCHQTPKHSRYPATPWTSATLPAAKNHLRHGHNPPSRP